MKQFLADVNHALYNIKSEKIMEKTQPLSQPLFLSTSFPSYPMGIQSNHSPSLSRDLNLEMVSDLEDIYDVIHYAIEKKQCVYWVRNTVADAQEAYQALKERKWIDKEKLTLLHGRFTVEDRQKIEEKVLENFGERSTHTQREGQVFIGTHVVEKTLDLDFDFVISDLAPVDHLLQQASCLQRHVRDEEGNRLYEADAEDLRVKPASLYIFGPEPTLEPDQDWLGQVLPRLESLAPSTSVLWLTQQALLQQQKANEEKGFGPCVLIPYDLKQLTDSVYGSGRQVLPEVWADQEEVFKTASSKLSLASNYGYRVHSSNSDYSEFASVAWNDSLHPSEHETVTVVLAKFEQGQLVPVSSDSEQSWAYSMVTVPKAQWEKAKASISENYQESISTLTAKEPSLAWVNILPMDEHTQGYYQDGMGWML